MTEDDKPPRRPASEAPEQINFAPVHKMVRWLSPKQLAGTGLQVALSGIFGSYSDKREIQASLAPPGPYPYDDRTEIWFDYVADLGDAFEPTYTIAHLLAAPALDVGLPGGAKVSTERGRLLVMGGDQAYPTASVQAYENQAVGPYRAALPYTQPSPDLYVIPGNHDWYDGLTAFMRVFCREQWVGGWQTRQTRSYFAAKLPHNWWLWGIDVQFESYIDEPQFDYFAHVGEDLQEGDSIILCSPMPSWVRASEREHPEAYATLDYLERKIIREKKAVVRLGLTGDSHHYAHYASTDGTTHKITAGGGGAFLSETHHLPRDLTVPPKQSKDPGRTDSVGYTLKQAFPDATTSRKLRWQVWRLPFLNWSFVALVAGIYLAYAWMIQASARGGDGLVKDGFVNAMGNLSYLDALKSVVKSPLAILVSVGLVFGMIGFTQSKARVKRIVLGVGHAMAHFALILGLIVVSAHVATSLFDTSSAVAAALYAVIVGAAGGLFGSWVMAAYLLVADMFGLNSNELFAAQRNRDHKCFLRLHLGPDGTLTVYPVGVARTVRHWKLRPEGGPSDPWYEPAGEAAAVELIEEPIQVRRPSS